MNATEIDELHREATDCSDFLKHLNLKLHRCVPGPLSGHGCIERKDQVAASCWLIPNTSKKRIDTCHDQPPFSRLLISLKKLTCRNHALVGFGGVLQSFHRRGTELQVLQSNGG